MFVPIPFAGMVEIDMDTNDLADRLEQFYSGTHIQKAAETLRQQQAEIDKLQEENIELQRLFDKAMDEWSKSKWASLSINQMEWKKFNGFLA